MNDPIQPGIELDRDFMPVLVICKNEGDPKKEKKIEAARVMTRFFPMLSHWDCVLPWQLGFHSNQSENIMQPFPVPDDAPMKLD